ncbi:hypothetical protein [Clostridium sardiniense]
MNIKQEWEGVRLQNIAIAIFNEAEDLIMKKSIRKLKKDLL